MQTIIIDELGLCVTTHTTSDDCPHRKEGESKTRLLDTNTRGQKKKPKEKK
jgi:hypothetical protein